jgi:hypothetical protein
MAVQEQVNDAISLIPPAVTGVKTDRPLSSDQLHSWHKKTCYNKHSLVEHTMLNQIRQDQP